MILKPSSLFLLLLAVTSCSEAAETTVESPTTDFAQELLGTWEAVSIAVNLNSADGRDTSYVLRIEEADWGRVYGVRPARTVFTADGKLRRTYRLKDGSPANVTHGIWKPVGTDSLFVVEPNVTFNYRHELENERLTLVGLVDYDLDGEEDDNYEGVFRLVGRTVE